MVRCEIRKMFTTYRCDVCRVHAVSPACGSVFVCMISLVSEMKHRLQDPLNSKDTLCLLSAGLLSWLCSYSDGNIWVAGMKKRAAEPPKTRNTDPPKQATAAKFANKDAKFYRKTVKTSGKKKNISNRLLSILAPPHQMVRSLYQLRDTCRLCAFFSLWNKLWPSSSIPFFP